jgi:hypothetical protein
MFRFIRVKAVARGRVLWAGRSVRLILNKEAKMSVIVSSRKMPPLKIPERVTGKPEVIGSSVGLVTTSALASEVSYFTRSIHVS